MEYNFYKEKGIDKVFCVDNVNDIDQHLFSFDKKKIYNLFEDYPHNLTKEERIIFNSEKPYWKEFFKNRQ